jgi:CRP/FNR family transcriptional regulator
MSPPSNGQAREIESDLRFAPLFSALPDSALEQCSNAARPCQYASGECLYREDESADSLYIIRQGRVKITRSSAEGKELILGFFGRGDFVGCCCMLDQARLPCTAQAVEPTTALRIARADFLKLAGTYPPLAMGALQEVTRMLRGAHHKLQDLALNPVDKRIVTTLLDLDQRFGADSLQGARVIRCRITRQELAQLSGTTLESASRAMSKLKRAGWIRSSRRGIVLVSPPALERCLTQP